MKAAHPDPPLQESLLLVQPPNLLPHVQKVLESEQLLLCKWDLVT
jgi:hypothetical protein